MSNVELKKEDLAKATSGEQTAPAPSDGTKSLEEIKMGVVDAVRAIKDGPRAMRLYMETCVKCGTCASVCPVYSSVGTTSFCR